MSVRRLFLLAAAIVAVWVSSASAQTITEFPLPSPGSNPFGIAAGPDGNLWFTEDDLGLSGIAAIGRMTPAGVAGSPGPLSGTTLVYTFRLDTRDHLEYRAWMEDLVSGSEACASSDIVLSGFIRVVTHPRIFSDPAPTEMAIRFADSYRANPNCVLVTPGPRHWGIFIELCRVSGARGALIADAYLAALAIESGCEWITTDRDFSRFPGLRWRHPLAKS